MKKFNILKLISILSLIAAAAATGGVSRQGLYQPKDEPTQVNNLNILKLISKAGNGGA